MQRFIRCKPSSPQLPISALQLSLRTSAMAGGLQWRNALARALKSEEVTRRSPLPVQLQRRAFSAQAPPARSTSFLQAHIQSPSQTRCSQQWRQQSLPAQSFAPNRRKFSTTPIARHNHLDPPKPGEECVSLSLYPCSRSPLLTNGYLDAA